MTDVEQRALVVLGGGPGGYVAAIRSAQLGIETTLVEQAHLGGVCLNEGCVPSKQFIHDAEETGADAALGLIDGPRISERFRLSRSGRDSNVARLRAGIGALLRANGVEMVAGTGTIVDRHALSITTAGRTREIRFDDLIIATGSEPIVPTGLQVDGSFVVTAREVLMLEHVPRRALVVGGGYIGLELASALRRFGTDVVVVEATDRLLPGIEPALAEHLRHALVADGIDVRLGSRVVKVSDGKVSDGKVSNGKVSDGKVSDGKVSDGVVSVTGPSGDSAVETDVVVVAVGRRPRTTGIGLGAAGLSVTDTGHLDVDDQMRTAVAHVRAVGDVTPGPALAHRAMAQGRIAAESVAGKPVSYRPAAVPAVVFTTPEVATVGLRLGEAIELGLDAREVRFPLAANARGLTLSSDGFGLLVHDAPSGIVLGVHLVGPGVGEMIGTATLAIEMGAVLEDLAGTIFPHPTLSEIFGELADRALGRPIHTAPVTTTSSRRDG